MSIKVQISVGEFLDKLSILEIKQSKIRDQEKLANINKEYDALIKQWENSIYTNAEIKEELSLLSRANKLLWDIEEKIRAKESKKEFDSDFIELARSVYLTNDERARIKRKINDVLNSDLIEEKSYQQS